MSDTRMSKATLGRLPDYLRYLKAMDKPPQNISAARIAHALGYGEVQVRKDLGAVSGQGRPKTGYDTSELRESLEQCLGQRGRCAAVLVGAGKLGRALLDYSGFSDYGLEIAAAFDAEVEETEESELRKPIFPMREFEPFCRRNKTRIGIIAVPPNAAQGVCDRMVNSGIHAIWNFAPVHLHVPDRIALCQEDLALSLAYLKQQCCFAVPYREE